MTADKMYAVTSGAYSDYRVLCLCMSKSDAEVIAAKYRSDPQTYGGADVASFPIVDASVEQIATHKMTCEVWDDGTTSPTREGRMTEWPFDTLNGLHPVKWRWVRAPVHQGIGGRLDVWGTDLERVRRVFSDRRAMLIADSDLRAKRERTGDR